MRDTKLSDARSAGAADFGKGPEGHGPHGRGKHNHKKIPGCVRHTCLPQNRVERSLQHHADAYNYGQPQHQLQHLPRKGSLRLKPDITLVQPVRQQQRARRTQQLVAVLLP